MECSDKILEPEIPHALRLQGILVGGIVRIYNKQQTYLLGKISSSKWSFAFFHKDFTPPAVNILALWLIIWLKISCIVLREEHGVLVGTYTWISYIMDVIDPVLFCADDCNDLMVSQSLSSTFHRHAQSV